MLETFDLGAMFIMCAYFLYYLVDKMFSIVGLNIVNRRKP